MSLLGSSILPSNVLAVKCPCGSKYTTKAVSIMMDPVTDAKLAVGLVRGNFTSRNEQFLILLAFISLAVVYGFVPSLGDSLACPTMGDDGKSTLKGAQHTNTL